MVVTERQAQHRAALQSARDSLSFILGELGDAKEGIVAHASDEEVNQLGHVRDALDAVAASTRLAVALITPILAQYPQEADLLLEAAQADAEGLAADQDV